MGSEVERGKLKEESYWTGATQITNYSVQCTNEDEGDEVWVVGAGFHARPLWVRKSKSLVSIY